MTDPYLAPSLAVLRAEINTRWPNRDHTSDGWIGDAAHQATKSDHNPNERGSVDAIDVDKDGIDPYLVIAAFERHPSAHYWIYQRQIADRDDGWRRRPYTGTNPHDKHVHFSIRQSRTAEQDTRPWGLLEDDMALTDAQAAQLTEVLTLLRRIYSGTVGEDNALTWWIRSLADQTDPLLRSKQPSFKPLPGPGLAQLGAQLAAVRADLAALAGRDLVDEQAIVAGVLAGLPADKIAAAIPSQLAKDVADELARRIAS